MPTSTVENYLKAILVSSERAEGEATVGELAEALGVTPGSVTTMTKGLAAKGLLDHRPREGVRLTPSGRTLALNVLRKHRLVETFLVQILKMDWTEIHEEAEALEHAISDRLLARIDALLGHPSADPHGDPIPGPKGRLAESGAKTTLATCAPQRPLRVVRISDQTPEFLEFIQKSGLKPGARLRVAKRDPASGVVHCDRKAEGETVLGFPEARKIEVQVVT
jgi:DtxR family transcriptional regulator, Mn-dependent transcriptional regulator